MSDKNEQTLLPLVPDVFHDIAAFHEQFDLRYEGDPRTLPPRLQAFREKFILEEFAEFQRAVFDEHAATEDCLLRYTPVEQSTAVNKAREQQLDAIVDLMYVLLGYAYLRGWYVPEAWRRVHEKNLLKRRATAQEPRRSEWDVVKPEGWTPADLSDLV